MKNLVTVGVFVFCVVQMASAKGVGLAGDTVGRVSGVGQSLEKGDRGRDVIAAGMGSVAADGGNVSGEGPAAGDGGVTGEGPAADGGSVSGEGPAADGGSVSGEGPAAGDGRVTGEGRVAAAGDTIRELTFAVGASHKDGHVSGVKMKNDTVPQFDWNKKQPSYKDPFPLRSFVVPGIMIAYGATALHSNHLQSLNREVKEEVWMDNPHKQFHLDNYLMFAPALSVYALNIAGIHGKHNFKDRTILLLLSNAIAQSVVFSTKGWTHELRPSGNDYLSFPSGHTAEAFANAEFMRMEYKDVSTWYVVGGYAMATATGLLRMYNNAHWMSDVIAGAGVGMASTRLAYWLYPKIQHWFGKGGDTQGTNASMLAPTYSNGAFGLSFVKVFK